MVIISYFNDKLVILQTHSFSLHKMLFDGVARINGDVFISSLDSHSDGTHSLQRIHWWSDGKWCCANIFQICTDEEINSSTFWMAWGRVHF